MEERQFIDLDEKLELLALRRQAEATEATIAFEELFTVGWIYHDNALEGRVLTYQEIRDALARKTAAESTLGPIYAEVRDHKAAIDLIKSLAKQPFKPDMITIALIKHLYEILNPELKSKVSVYRHDKDHSRLYHHSITSFDKIPEQLRKLCTSMKDHATFVHPLAQAIHIHYEIMRIYPWSRNSGKMARLLMNLLLLRSGYPPAVIPGHERQRYYASLSRESGRLSELVTDSLESYCAVEIRYFNELAARRPGPGHGQASGPS